MNIEQFNPKYPYKIKVEVEWPAKYWHEEQQRFFYFDSVLGERLSDGCPSAKYWSHGQYAEFEDSIWLNLDGTVTEEED
jgi:hypothetical protein